MRRSVRRLPAAALVALLACAGAAVAQPSLPAPVVTPDGAWVHVQLADLVEPEQVDALAEAGLEAMQYVPDNAYVAFATDDAVRAARTVPGVTSVEVLRADEKLDPELPLDVRTRVTVIGYRPEAGLDRTLLGRGAQRLVSAALGDGGMAIREYSLPAGLLASLSRRSDVLLVTAGTGRPETEDEATSQILASPATEGFSIKPGYEAFLKKVGVTGAGVTVTINDEGLDPNHPELSGRIVERYEHSPIPAEGHGTHVAGIAGGKGASLPALGRIKDENGFMYGMGIAPGVKFVDINAISTGADFPPAEGFGVYTKQALASGSTVWNASWTSGEGAGSGYVANAALLDALARDADDEKAGLQPFTFVFSAGNSGSREMSITAPKEAKNIIAVASTRSPRGALPINDGPDGESLSSFSSRGPARDGRLMPLVAAPGENIVSSRATTGTTCGETPMLDGFALYSLCSGTSMASPQVVGAVALLTEWWRKRNRGAAPSPAMAKAMLVNSATDIGERDIPNTDEGWGRVHLGALLDPTAKRIVVDQKVVLVRRGQAHTLRVKPIDPRKPMKVSLAWTDAPGLAQERRTDKDFEDFSPAALVNDLDLRVTAGKTRFWGNVFSGGRSVPGGRPDRLNNVENVFVAKPGGTYLVSVIAHNLPGDGIPGNKRRVDQDFALVLVNARLV